MSPTKRIAAVTVLCASGAGAFLGFYECGAYLWIRQAVSGTALLSITLLFIVFVVAQRRAAPSPSSRMLQLYSISFASGSAIIFLAFQALGEIIYLPPRSFGEFWHKLTTFSLGCA
ncbi:hypothetical protein [Thiorhodococcus fuscus]|uniref:Uncharacterized protein n=1 Tax=Thiorhodococcus fuscus TaxID=527200 RepID=A0ABW4Y889_9GAMM